MLKLTLHPVALPLRHAWTIAHGTRTTQHNLIVALHDTDTGHTGYGEAPAIPYYDTTVEGMATALESQRGLIESVKMDLPIDLWMPVAEAMQSQPFPLSALDEAAHDLYGKREGKPMHELWGLTLGKVPRSDYTLGFDSPEKMIAKFYEYPRFPYYKIKLGTGNIEIDTQVVEAIRTQTPVPLRVDANGGWTVDEAIEMSHRLVELGVEFIEQPLDWEAHESEFSRLVGRSILPIIADESFQGIHDLDFCAAYFNGINLKLSKTGGMLAAPRIIADARKLELRVMAGCMTETTVGISALAQLLPLLDDVDMDGALLLAPGSDIADGVKVNERGVAVFPQGEAGHGNGVRLTRELPVYKA